MTGNLLTSTVTRADVRVTPARGPSDPGEQSSYVQGGALGPGRGEGMGKHDTWVSRNEKRPPRGGATLQARIGDPKNPMGTRILAA